MSANSATTFQMDRRIGANGISHAKPELQHAYTHNMHIAGNDSWKLCTTVEHR